MSSIFHNYHRELHLKSTLSELLLHEATVEPDEKTYIVRKIFDNDNMLPGVIVTNHVSYSVLSRRVLFEKLSKPYSLELFNKRPISFLMENLNNVPDLILPSSMLITTAVQKCLERYKYGFDEPIIVEFENGSLKMLDCYELILAHSVINQIALMALKQADELKTELLSIAAHDLKNPLNTIINLIKIIKSEISDGSTDIVEMAEQILKTAEHMLNLIIELLNSTVIESGRLKLNKQLTDLAEIVFAIIYLNRTPAESKSQRLDFIINNDYYIIDADGLKIREAIENLVSNAIKYSPFDTKIEVKLEKIDDKIILSVKDEGPGFTPDDMTKLFCKFQRLSALPTAGESSTGLGLYIAKQIVELHDGSIWVESEHGFGSKFIIELPAQELPD
ncbi:MAG: hypothetical protein QG635_1924 [Bacteroidota bacterium]|nr:hypothetical protein [Bacteroidota bacterium]